ncbi:hypothetical protein THARTR1_10799 [Trichoderma harzianum]|uniref:Nephrocystin 3-like N-terminal domain-containing protein n=1 Tax=Trichoderma harzianum TaxID=5544 RepID=A0A2K0TLR7_TRIHA|nr:hypothetical protein THARTR1_10799 [Trichoderma harzianum]
MPRVRAICYGYDSHLIGSTSFQTIGDIARSLIWDLRSGGWNLPSSRPIIFLAHSLGGIVLKEAIVQIANNGDRSVSGILNNLLGAVMFGVPSLGMQQSHLMAMVEGQANEMLVQDLSRENGTHYLRQLNKAFNGLSIISKVKILWAYETQESHTTVKGLDGNWSENGPLAVLVNRDSATCNYNGNDGSLTIPINKSHSNMVKFSRGDNDLGKIIFSLNDFLQNGLGQPLLTANGAFQGRPALLEMNMDHRSAIEGVLTEGEEVLSDLSSVSSAVQEIYDDLYLPELDYRITQIEDPFQNTFKWIFGLDLFTDWLRKGSGLFWINGKPGSGKSTLMKYIFQSPSTWELLHDWMRSSLDVKAAFFFHFRGTAMQKSFEGVLRSLIIQVLQPHLTAFQKQYQKIWEEFQHWNQKRASLKNKLEAILKNEGLIDSEGDLEKHTQRAKDDGENEATKNQIDIEQRLSLVRMRIKEADNRNQYIQEDGLNFEQGLRQLRADIANLTEGISLLARKAGPFQTQPETKLLRSIVA